MLKSQSEQPQNSINNVSICPMGESFALPNEDDYAKEIERFMKIEWKASGRLSADGRSAWIKVLHRRS